ncbi:bifunctional [glutamine synthetase] adenylyltransferase/[glutamine synthetase]-adenylyl-L-tyrosine phosphorylase [Arcanobacterium hippocoleae]
MVERAESIQAKLARAGFQDSLQAARLFTDPLLENTDKDWLLALLGETADPDLALLGYVRLTEAVNNIGKPASEVLAHTCQTKTGSSLLFAVLGFSAALSEFLIANPLLLEIFTPAQIAHSSLHCTPTQEREKMYYALAEYLDLTADIMPHFAAGKTVNKNWQIPTGSSKKLSADNYKRAVSALRRYYWQRIAQIAAIDLSALDATEIFTDVSQAITRLVDAVLDGALAIAGRQVSESERIKFSIITMGKAGAQEINYISDVDVIYLAAENKNETEAELENESGSIENSKNADSVLDEAKLIEIGTKIAFEIAKIVSAPGEVPALWELDPNLRPEGKDGPLVRTLDSYLSYYQRWAKGWEFQALLKARPAAGDLTLGSKLIAGVQEGIWNVAQRESFVAESQAMRRRVLDLVPAKEAPRQLKLGKGGLRDIEFTVQLLQLVHGRTDESLRVCATLDGLAALSDGGYISRADAAKLAQYYKFLRVLEHRIQLYRFRRSHLVPTAQLQLQRIARSLRKSIPGIYSGEDLERYWQQVRGNVRALHLEIYYRPLIPAVAKLSADDAALEPEAAKARLSAIGYRDPRGALMQISALTAGITRTALIQRHLLPVLIGWFGAGADPDQGLRSFRILSEQMGATSWYLRTLRDSGTAAKRLAKILSCSKYLAQELPKLSEAISWLDDDALLLPRSAEELQEELDALLSRRTEPSEIAMAGRYLRRKELLRTALAQVLGLIDERQVQRVISAAGDIAIAGALRAAECKFRQKYCVSELPFEFAVIALGRFGGNELSYASDADVIFVHRPFLSDSVLSHTVLSDSGEIKTNNENVQPADVCADSSRLNPAQLNITQSDSAQLDNDQLAIEFTRDVLNFLNDPGSEPTFEIDTRLRPEGKNGPLSRSLASYAQYYERWVELWERQALLRARFCGGSTELGKDFCSLSILCGIPLMGLVKVKSGRFAQ